MAANKAKRSIHLTQPNHSSVELAPVKAHVYHFIAELNAGLEKAIQNLQALRGNNLFRTSGLTTMNHMLRGIRARANRHLMSASTNAKPPTPATIPIFASNRKITSQQFLFHGGRR